MATLKAESYNIDNNDYQFIPPLATETERGGFLASPKDDNYTEEVKVGRDGKFYTKPSTGATFVVWEEDSNTATYIIDTDIPPHTEDIVFGSSCLSPSIDEPKKDGYEFVGWRLDNTASSEVEEEVIMGATPITLYAVFKYTYYVTCISVNDETKVPAYKYYNYGNETEATCIAPSYGSYDGWDWRGWSNDNDTAANAKILVSVDDTIHTGNKDLTLYGLYKKGVTLSYDGNGATSGSVSANDEGVVYYNAAGKTKEAEITVAPNGFTRNGFIFNCWKTSAGVEYNSDDKIKIGTDTTLYAQWTASSYVVYTANVVENDPRQTATTFIDSNYVSVSAPGIYPQALSNPDYQTFVWDKSETLTISINYGEFSRATIVFNEANSNQYTNPMGVVERAAYITYQGEATKDCGGADDITKTTTASTYSVTCSAHLDSSIYGEGYTWVNSGVSIRSITLHV